MGKQGMPVECGVKMRALGRWALVVGVSRLMRTRMAGGARERGGLSSRRAD